MSLIKPKFAQTANALCHVSMSNRNAFSLFLKVLRDMSVDHRSCDRLFQSTAGKPSGLVVFCFIDMVSAPHV